MKIPASRILITAVCALSLAVASCGGGGGGSSSPRPSRPQPQPQPQRPAPAPPTRPQIDLALTSLSAPNRVRDGQPFDVTVRVANRSGPRAAVANIELRVQVQTPTGTSDTGAGSGVVRDLGPSQEQAVTIRATARGSRKGLGTLTAKVKVLSADDPNSANNSSSRSLVVD